MRRLSKISLYIIFILFPVNLVMADMLYDASQLEREGKYNEAINLYDSWLEEHKEDPRFLEVLFHSSSIIDTIDETLNFLKKYEDRVTSLKQQQLFLRIAQTYELAFQNEDASIYYEKASRKSDSNLDYEIYLKYLMLNYQLGKISQIEEINNILLSKLNTGTYVDALIFKSELLKYQREYNLAINILQQDPLKNLYPEIHFALWEIHLLNNDLSSAQNTMDVVKKNFPDSIEYGVMKGLIRRIPRLSNYFIGVSIQQTQSYIQVGSFSNPGNLQTISHSLDIYNYDYFYIQENNLTKVIVSDNLSSEELLIKLKSHGFEGFKINYQKIPD